MAETVEKKGVLLIKETISIDEVNRRIRQGWTLLSVKQQFGKYMFTLIKE